MNGSASAVAAQVLRHARASGSSSVLVLTNARYESLHDLLDLLRSGGVRARSPRELDETAFACSSSYVYATVAEMLGCSRARHFLGSPRSSFSLHIAAMREARGNNGSAVEWLKSSK